MSAVVISLIIWNALITICLIRTMYRLERVREGHMYFAQFVSAHIDNWRVHK